MPKAVNPGIEQVQKRGSRIIADGKPMMGAASLMMAAGIIGNFSDLKKKFITVINSYTTQIPGHIHLDI